MKADKTDWYYYKIGKIYVVKKVQEFCGKKYYEIRNYNTIFRAIYFDDAEPI